MPRTLTEDELIVAREVLNEIRQRLEVLSGGDPSLLFAYRRKIAKHLEYDERDNPTVRKNLKMLKWGLQNRTCVHCNQPLALKYSHLDRRDAEAGYTEENTELIHAECHHERQAAKGYK